MIPISTVREQLNQCRKLVFEIQRISKAWELIRLPGKPTMPRTPHAPREGCADNMPLYHQLAVLDELDKLYEQRTHEYHEKVLEVELLIGRLDDARDRSILREYYVMASSLRDAARALHISKGSLIQWKENAVRRLECIK